MRSLYAVLAVFSLATQVVAAPLIAEGEVSAKAETDVNLRTTAQRCVSIGKNIAFLLSGIFSISISFAELNIHIIKDKEIENLLKNLHNKTSLYYHDEIYDVSSLIALSLTGVEIFLN